MPERGAEVRPARSWRGPVFLRRVPPDLLACLAIGAVALLFYLPFLLAGPDRLVLLAWEFAFDIQSEIWPILAFIKDGIQQHGALPLWRGYLMGGTPVIGHPIAPVFYPPYWLFLLVPLPLGLNLLSVAHLAWFGSGVYMLARRLLGTSVPASALAGALFAVAPKWIGHLSGGQWFMLCALAWWPWAIYFFVRLLRENSTRPRALAARVLPLALTLAVINLVHLPTLVVTGLTLLVVLLVELFRPVRGAVLRPALLGGSAAALLAVALSAVQFFPFLELVPYTLSNLGRGTYTSLSPALLLTVLFPSTFRYPEMFIFPGVGLLFFSAYALLHRRGGPSLRWPALTVLLGVLLSLGDYTPLYALLFKWNGLLSLVRVPPRWWLLALTGLALLSAAGVDAFLRERGAARRGAKLGFAVLVLLYGGALGLAAWMGEDFPFEPLAPALGMGLIAVALLLRLDPRRKVLVIAVVALASVFASNYRYIITRPEAEVFRGSALTEMAAQGAARGERSFAARSLTGGLYFANGMRAAEGYDPFRLTNYAGLLKTATGCRLSNETLAPGETWAEVNRLCLGSAARWDWLRLLNVTTLIVPRDNPAPARGELVLSDEEARLYRLEPGMGYLWGARRAEPVSPDAACFARLAQVDPAVTALVEGAENFPAEPGALEVLGWREPGPGRLEVEVRAPDGGLLLRSEAWAPGWRAVIDGQPARVLRADCALQAVLLPAGATEVTFLYDPPGYRAGKWVSLLAVLALAAGWRYSAQR